MAPANQICVEVCAVRSIIRHLGPYGLRARTLAAQRSQHHILGAVLPWSQDLGVRGCPFQSVAQVCFIHVQTIACKVCVVVVGCVCKVEVDEVDEVG